MQLDLEIDGWQVLHVPPLPNPNVARVRDRPWFATTYCTQTPNLSTAFLYQFDTHARYSKLHVFGLTQFDIVVFIDADTLPLANLDSLFLSNTSSLAAAPEMMPPDTFNTGLMVVRPSHALSKRVMQARGSVSSYDGSDQGFLNSVFQVVHCNCHNFSLWHALSECCCAGLVRRGRPSALPLQRAAEHILASRAPFHQ